MPHHARIALAVLSTVLCACDSKPAAYTVTTRDGKQMQVTLDERKLPPELPNDFPLYPGSTIVTVGRTGKSVVTHLSTKDPPDAVVRFYAGRADYVKLSDVAVEDYRVVRVKQQAGTGEVQVMVKADGGATEIDLVVGS